MTQLDLTYFTSYAQADGLLADDFVERLGVQLAPSRSYRYALWRDTSIPVGANWREEIDQALALALPGLAAALALTALVWLASLAKRDASIVDIFWSLGFVMLAWLYRGQAPIELAIGC